MYLSQGAFHLASEKVSEYKEVFQLFDKDEDGVLSFTELSVVMRSLGQLPSGIETSLTDISTLLCSLLFSCI